MRCSHSCRKHRCCGIGDSIDAETNACVMGVKENGHISYWSNRPDFVVSGNILLHPVHNYMIGTHPVYISATIWSQCLHQYTSQNSIIQSRIAHQLAFHIQPTYSSVHWPRSSVRICLTAFDSNELGFEMARISPPTEDTGNAVRKMHPCTHVL